MNSHDIFRKLTRGIKFDRKRFEGDLQRIGVFHKGKKENEDGSKPEEIPIPSEPMEVVTEEPSSVGDSPNKNKENEEVGGGGVQILTDLHFDKSLTVSKKRKKKKKGKEVEKSAKMKEFERKKELVNQCRNKNGIHVWGTDVPGPLVSFDQLVEEYKVNEVITSNLLNQGYEVPMAIQMQAWPLMLQGREILGSAPTGSGKTAAFLVPVLHQLQGPQKKGFRAILLAPTRELARQTYRECVRLSEGLGFRIHIINNVNRARQKFGPNSSKKFDILVTTPNRLVFLLQGGETPAIDLSNVEWLVIDESDRLFEGGSGGFRDQLAIIYQACTGPKIKRALFSATFAYEVQHWCKLNLNNVVMVSVGIRNTASSDVKQELLFCGAEHGKLVALRDILRKGYKPPVLVFVQTKERAKELFRELIYDNIMVDAIHADRTQTQRDNVVRAFRERKIWVLICTELMARGIDFKGVNLVINYDFPASAISYIHRVGRTGRAHHQGRAVTFWTVEDKPYLHSIAKIIHDARQEVPEWMLTLNKPPKNRKKKSHALPERGHVSQYDVYRECTYRQEKIKQNRKRKMEKKAAREASGETDTGSQSLTENVQDDDDNGTQVEANLNKLQKPQRKRKSEKKKKENIEQEEPKRKKKKKQDVS